MVEWRSLKDYYDISEEYNKESSSKFPEAELLLRIRTTPISEIAISIYPNQEKADEAKIKGIKTLKSMEPRLRINGF